MSIQDNVENLQKLAENFREYIGNVATSLDSMAGVGNILQENLGTESPLYHEIMGKLNLVESQIDSAVGTLREVRQDIDDAASRIAGMHR